METLDTFLEEIRNRAAPLCKGEPRVWYRGLSNREHQLIPSLFRQRQGRPREAGAAKKNLRQIEKNLFARFRTQAGELLPSGLESSEILSTMQHYGVPTRMMDWTDSLFVALY